MPLVILDDDELETIEALRAGKALVVLAPTTNKEEPSPW